MSWSRFDDNWTRKIQKLGISYPARWHYVAMIQFCSATDSFDGVMRPADARTCSDVENAAECLAELEDAGLVTRHGDRHEERYVVIDIEDHVPPVHMRDKQRKPAGKARTQRWRAHKAGDHSMCLPENCTSTAPVTASVTRHVGTGQDGPGLEELPPHSGSKIPSQTGPRSDPPGDVDLLTGEIDECSECTEPLSWCKCPSVFRGNDPS